MYKEHDETKMKMGCCRLRMGLLALLLLLMAGGAECCGQTREPLLPVEYEPAGRQIDRSILVGIGHVSQWTPISRPWNTAVRSCPSSL